MGSRLWGALGALAAASSLCGDRPFPLWLAQNIRYSEVAAAQGGWDAKVLIRRMHPWWWGWPLRMTQGHLWGCPVSSLELAFTGTQLGSTSIALSEAVFLHKGEKNLTPQMQALSVTLLPFFSPLFSAVGLLENRCHSTLARSRHLKAPSNSC